VSLVDARLKRGEIPTVEQLGAPRGAANVGGILATAPVALSKWRKS
jgi:hypothetical protein